jgi:hypothetical protein
MNDRRTVARQAGLLAIAFVATFVLLAGLALGLAGRAPARSGASPTGVHSPAPTLAVSPGGASQPVTAPPSAGAAASPSAAATPSAAPAGSPDPILVGAGDIGDCASSGDEATATLLDGIPGAIFTAGDNAYPDGSADNYARCYDPTWGRFKARTHPAAGNHDWVTKDAAGYLGYFGKAATNADGKTWYSYELGAWHVVVLDSNCGFVDSCAKDSPQGRWLSADLAASTARCTVAIWHAPRFSSGNEHGNDPDVDPFWRALYAAGADVVINGHDHDYERFAPQAPAGELDRQRGIREFVVGTGGTPLRGFDTPKSNSDIRAAVDHGVLKLTLHPRGYDWAFVTPSGVFSDSGSATCH